MKCGNHSQTFLICYVGKTSKNTQQASLEAREFTDPNDADCRHLVQRFVRRATYQFSSVQKRL